MSIYELMRYCRNFFPDRDRREEGTFTIENGTPLIDNVEDGQLFLIEGSKFADGVHEYPCYDLRDETFEGAVTPLCPPKEFLMLHRDIDKWQQEQADIGPYVSESFGGYTYTKATDQHGYALGWKGAFADRLSVFRRV